jgi:hypothetical protein
MIGHTHAKFSDPTEPDRPSTRVKDAVSALRIATDKRREQLNQKRISSTSNAWAQTLPGVPGPLKKSLWHKMHRRRQQVVLRPSLESLAADLRTSVSQIPAPGGSRRLKSYSVEEETLKAEQLFLLSVHPAAPVEEPLRSVPSSGSNDHWAEPGKLPCTQKPITPLSISHISLFLFSKVGASFSTFQKSKKLLRSCPVLHLSLFSSTIYLSFIRRQDARQLL